MCTHYLYIAYSKMPLIEMHIFFEIKSRVVLELSHENSKYCLHILIRADEDLWP